MKVRLPEMVVEGKRELQKRKLDMAGPGRVGWEPRSGGQNRGLLLDRAREARTETRET